MATNRVVCFNQGYFSSLIQPEKDRYKEKIKFCKDLDPYEVNLTEFSVIDVENFRQKIDLLPLIEHGDVVNHLLYSTNFITMKEAKAYKSLESHNFFTSGFVKNRFYIKRIENKALVLGEVNHSQSLRNDTLKAWILADMAGEIITGHCTCMAGQSETCSHVGAILFAIEYAVRLKDQTSSTSMKNMWLPVYSKNAPISEVRKVSFESSKLKKQKLDDSFISNRKNSAFVASIPEITEPTEDEISAFLKKTKDTGVIPVILKVHKEFCDEFVQKHEDVILPRLFRGDMTLSSLDSIKQLAREIFSKMKISPQKSAAIEVATKNQYLSKDWYLYRAGRLTASVMKAVFTANPENPPLSLVKRICYPDKQAFFSPATEWGKKNEKVALAEYEKKMRKEHEDILIQKSGLHINVEFPHIGATPDALVNCNCCGSGAVEIKCPYTLRTKRIVEIAGQGDSCLTVDEIGNITLKKDHSYYYQIQTQLNVCNLDFLDFVIWTQSDFYSQRFYIDAFFWETIIEKVDDFYKIVVLPELISKYYTKNKITENKENNL